MSYTTNPYLIHDPYQRNVSTSSNYTVKDAQSVSSSDDRIYYNVVMPYRPTVMNTSPMIYQEELSQALLTNPSDYYLSIVRFTIPTQNIPIFIAQVRPFPNTDLNSLIYSVTLTWNGFTSGQTFLQYLTTSPNALQSRPLTMDHPEADKTPYYYVFTYTQFLLMINNALQTAFTALGTASGGTLPIGSTAPFFIFDEINNRISLIAQNTHYNVSNVTPIKIFVNNYLFSFLDGIAVQNFGFNLPTGEDFQFLVRNEHNNFYNTPDTCPPPCPPTYLIMTQQYDTLTNWNSFKSLVLTSNLLPIKSEYVPRADFINQGQINTRGILKDFEPLLELGPEARTQVQYQLQSPYQLINLTNNIPLTKIDIAVYWSDQFGNLNLLTIPFNQIVTIKLIFIKKSTYQGY